MDSLNNETLQNGTNENSYHHPSSPCLPFWILNATDVQYVYTSDIIVAIVNISFAIFAFMVNLAVVITIVRTPSLLHRPVNVLLCSLATADCLTGLIAQPVYAAWRFILHHIADPCKLVHLHQASKSLPFLFVGCTFLNLAITSVERLYAVSKPIAYAARITLRGMVKTVVGAWIVWFIYVILLETVTPNMIYEPMENITMTSLIAIPIGGHILTFLAIRTLNRKILSATHNSQQAVLFRREKKAFTDMALYTTATLLSIAPILVLLNLESNIITANILFPWANTISYLVSSFNPIIQIWRNAALRQALKTTITTE